MGKITAKDIDVHSLLKRNNFFIPSYQRGYDWDEDLATQLFDDLFEHFKNNPSYDYFVGNIVVYNKRVGLNNELVIVDGQQRITTFMLLITAMRISVFSSTFLDQNEIRYLEEQLKELVINKITSKQNEEKIKIFSNRNEIISEIINCKLKEKNLTKNPWAKKISEKHKNTNYYKNLQIFINLINDKFTNFEIYNQFLKLLERVIFVVVDIDTDEDVHKIFENINSKGKELTLLDLIKNFLYILLEKEDDSENKNNLENEISEIFEKDLPLIKTGSSIFLINYLILLKEEYFIKSNEKSAYGEFKKIIQKKIKSNEIKLEKIILQLKQQINLIKYIDNFKSDNTSELYDLSLFMNKDNLINTMFPFIYKMAKIYEIFDEENLIINGQFEDFIIIMDKFFTRRYIVKASEKNYNKYIPTLLKKVDSLETYDIDSIEELLTNPKESSFSNGTLMEAKENVLKHFMENENPYSSNKSKEIKQIMFRINYFISLNSNEGISLTDEEYRKFTVEHIMPKNPKDDSIWLKKNKEIFNNLSLYEQQKYEDEKQFYKENVENWGNLTITQDNNKLSNKEFEEKKEILESSTLKINKIISNNNEWNLKEIKKRKEFLYSIIEKHF